MDTHRPPAYSGLTSVPGMVSVSCRASPDVASPFCATADLVFLMGKVSVSATISGDDLLSDLLPLVVVVCSKSHLFFLHEKATLRATHKPRQTRHTEQFKPTRSQRSPRNRSADCPRRRTPTRPLVRHRTENKMG